MKNDKIITNAGTNEPVDTEQETWLEESAEKADNEFPLSGAETDDDLDEALDEEDETNEDI